MSKKQEDIAFLRMMGTDQHRHAVNDQHRAMTAAACMAVMRKSNPQRASWLAIRRDLARIRRLAIRSRELFRPKPIYAFCSWDGINPDCCLCGGTGLVEVKHLCGRGGMPCDGIPF